jgi:hypothetical protein
MSEPVVNPDVLLWALYELGGADDFVDVEDVFLRAFHLAPMRLSWRTREDLPDLKKCSKSLQEAERRVPAPLVKRGPDMRKLTAEGQRWIEDNFDRLADALGSDRIVQPPRTRTPGRLVAEIARSPIFNTWTENRELSHEKWRSAELLRCSPDSARAVWRERLEALRSAAYSTGRNDVLEFLDALASKNSDWF